MLAQPATSVSHMLPIHPPPWPLRVTFPYPVLLWFLLIRERNRLVSLDKYHQKLTAFDSCPCCHSFLIFNVIFPWSMMYLRINSSTFLSFHHVLFFFPFSNVSHLSQWAPAWRHRAQWMRKMEYRREVLLCPSFLLKNRKSINFS